jgi:hypothetical protein
MNRISALRAGVRIRRSPYGVPALRRACHQIAWQSASRSVSSFRVE